MTTLVERCQEIRRTLSRHGDLRRDHKEAEAFRNRLLELRELREAVEGELERVNVLNGKGPAAGRIPSPTTALAALASYVERLRTPEADAGKEFGLLKRAAGKLH